MDKKSVPAHVAIIMDGNGRWAKSKGMPRTIGHAKGAQNLEDMLYIADELGIKYLTVYAFSTENWKRSEDEVLALMNLFRQYLIDRNYDRNICGFRMVDSFHGLRHNTVIRCYDQDRDIC